MCSGEALYYLTLLESALYFVENINGPMLGISDEDFKIYMEVRVLHGTDPEVSNRLGLV